MKKTLPKGLTALLIALPIGMLLVSCGPIFDIGDEIRGNDTGGIIGGNTAGEPRPFPIPSDGYTAVKAYDWMELADYLQSDDISYAITLTELENTNIYLQRNISIVKPMRIIGSPGTGHTIHSISREGGTGFYCIDLQADLELQYCSFTGYNGTTGTSSGIAAGSPPLIIGDGRTLTMTGKDSVLELRNVGSGSDIRTGSQVKLGDGTSFVDESGDLLFKAGVEKLIVSGNVSLKNKLTVGSDATLQIENGGELSVGPGVTLTLDNSLKELRLDGDIVVDRTGSPAGALVLTGDLTIDSLPEKITGGNGSLTIENGIPEETKPLQFGANTIVRLSGDGINIGKMDSSEFGGVIETSDDLIITKGKKLVLGAGMDFNIKNNLTLKGGVLNVAGNVNVTGGGQITISAEDQFYAIPKGSVVIGSSGNITIDDGAFIDESASPDAKSFSFPSYGSGSLIFKAANSTGGKAVIGEKEGIAIIGPSTSDALLKLASSPASSLSIKSGSTFTLSGEATLDISADLSLTGTFTVAGGAILRVNGSTFIVKSPNVLNGVIQPAASQIDARLGQVRIYADAITTNPGLTLSGKTYSWTASGWD